MGGQVEGVGIVRGGTKSVRLQVKDPGRKLRCRDESWWLTMNPSAVRTCVWIAAYVSWKMSRYTSSSVSFQQVDYRCGQYHSPRRMAALIPYSK